MKPKVLTYGAQFVGLFVLWHSFLSVLLLQRALRPSVPFNRMVWAVGLLWLVAGVPKCRGAAKPAVR